MSKSLVSYFFLTNSVDPQPDPEGETRGMQPPPAYSYFLTRDTYRQSPAYLNYLLVILIISVVKLANLHPSVRATKS